MWQLCCLYGFLVAIFISKQALCIIREDFSVCRMFWLVALKREEKHDGDLALIVIFLHRISQGTTSMTWC